MNLCAVVVTGWGQENTLFSGNRQSCLCGVPLNIRTGMGRWCGKRKTGKAFCEQVEVVFSFCFSPTNGCVGCCSRYGGSEIAL